MLRTFIAGLLAVFLFQSYFNHLIDVKVNLPEIESKSPLLVMPEDKIFWTNGGGSGPDNWHEETGERHPPELKERFRQHQKIGKIKR